MSTDQIDAIACEPQFIDHVAPVWRALPKEARGEFLVASTLTYRAEKRGVVAYKGIDVRAIRISMPPPAAKPPGSGKIALVSSIGDTKIGRRLGYDRFVFIEHGAGQAYDGDRGSAGHPSYAGGMDRDDTVLFLCPNEYSASRWRKAYPDARVVIVGSPHVGDLPDRIIEPHLPYPVVAVSFHWPGSFVQEAHTALGTYALELKNVARAWPTIGHSHPKGDWPNRAARAYRRAGIEVVTDFHEVCERADIYVCDNSSTIFEFAATGRPVVVLNMRDYRRNVNHGLRFWDAAHVGMNVDKPEDLVKTIAVALTDPIHAFQDREDALTKVYPEDDIRGRIAARRASDEILELLGWPRAVPLESD